MRRHNYTPFRDIELSNHFNERHSTNGDIFHLDVLVRKEETPRDPQDVREVEHIYIPCSDLRRGFYLVSSHVNAGYVWACESLRQSSQEVDAKLFSRLLETVAVKDLVIFIREVCEMFERRGATKENNRLKKQVMSKLGFR